MEGIVLILKVIGQAQFQHIDLSQKEVMMDSNQKVSQALDKIAEITEKLIESNTAINTTRDLCLTTSMKEISITQFHSTLSTIINTNKHFLQMLDDLNKILAGPGKYKKRKDSKGSKIVHLVRADEEQGPA